MPATDGTAAAIADVPGAAERRRRWRGRLAWAAWIVVVFGLYNIGYMTTMNGTIAKLPAWL